MFIADPCIRLSLFQLTFSLISNVSRLNKNVHVLHIGFYDFFLSFFFKFKFIRQRKKGCCDTMPFRAFLVCLSCKDICSYFVQLFFFFGFPTKYIKNRTCALARHIVSSLSASNPMSRRWGSLCMSENNNTKVLSNSSSNVCFLFLNLLKQQTSILIGNFESAILTMPPYGKFS